MTMMQWLSQTIQEMSEWFRPIRRELAPVYQERQTGGRRRKALYVALVVGASFSSGVPLTSWSAELPSLVPAKVRKIVAAGVGYENAEASSITVKTYDAETGTVLTEDTYELNVREDATSAAGQPRERIFAGGVGPGVDGLSTFSLRVYDAATGKFLWEGLLNLNVSNHESDFTHRVVAHLAPQALVTQIRSRGAIDGQPQFFLRAVDSASGQLVWTDHFSAGSGALARAERIGRAVVGQTEGFSVPAQQIEFRIRMFDDGSRKLLWEDTIEPGEEETEVAVRQDDAAETLPAWHSAVPKDVIEEAI
ncbi:MAG: hypothetical protein Q8L74_03690 [Nitrospirota bacterium]|nr:hypothetical protein [Nitrospirota bacterium]MDP2381169.1 hypothetical protein [Nitrospirota bacterium]MDP3596198.1 hypothetical protein [Nitrospirota bacterium]